MQQRAVMAEGAPPRYQSQHWSSPAAPVWHLRSWWQQSSPQPARNFSAQHSRSFWLVRRHLLPVSLRAVKQERPVPQGPSNTTSSVLNMPRAWRRSRSILRRMSAAPLAGEVEAARVYTLGTVRSRDPAATLALLLPHLPRFGITRLANVTGLDRVGIPVYQAIRPNSRGLSLSQGKGIDATAAKVSALME